jgi:hypothetical protein
MVMEKKLYQFDFDITGKCIVSTNATSLEEAIENIKNGDDLEHDLVEWDADYPTYESEIKSSWANKSDFK